MDAQLKAVGIARPVTALWFSTPRAAVGVVSGAIFALIGMWFAWSFHLYPDQVVRGRGSWMMIDHGEGGFLFGLVAMAVSIGFGARAMWQLATRRSAFAITAQGVLTEQPFVGRRLWAWNRIECVKIERYYAPRRLWFTQRKMYATLALYPLATPGDTVKPVKIAATMVEGGLFRACRFADTLDRVMGMVRAGRL
jgi:hypothetical protein